jgi:hypothetical protein
VPSVPDWLAFASLSFHLRSQAVFFPPSRVCLVLRPNVSSHFLMQVAGIASSPYVVSELLIYQRRVLDVSSDWLLIIGSSMLLAKTLTTGSLVEPAPLDGSPELTAPNPLKNFL